MKHRRIYAVEIKNQIVEELLSGMSGPAQRIRRYEIFFGFLYHWKSHMPWSDSTMSLGKKPLLKPNSATGTIYRQMNPKDMQIRLPFFIQEVHNHKRPHSSLGYKPLVEFEKLFYKNLRSRPTTLTLSI